MLQLPPVNGPCPSLQLKQLDASSSPSRSLPRLRDVLPVIDLMDLSSFSIWKFHPLRHVETAGAIVPFGQTVWAKRKLYSDRQKYLSTTRTQVRVLCPAFTMSMTTPGYFVQELSTGKLFHTGDIIQVGTPSTPVAVGVVLQPSASRRDTSSFHRALQPPGGFWHPFSTVPPHTLRRCLRSCRHL